TALPIRDARLLIEATKPTPSRSVRSGTRFTRPETLPDEPQDAEDDERADDGVRLVEPGREDLAMLPHLHADEPEAQAPRERADERVRDELPHRHPPNAGGEGDERPHDRQEAPDENGDVALAREEALRPAEMRHVEEDVLAVFL